MTAILSPSLIFQGLGFGGFPLPGGKLYSYIAGTSTPQTTYVDSTETTPNANPVILNANGQALVWLDPTLVYKFKLTDALGNQIYVTDQVQGSLTAAALSTILTQAYLGAILNPQTPAEAAAGVVPVNLQYGPGYVDRYGTNTTPGTTDMSSAFSTAALVANKLGCSVRFGATAPYRLNNPVNWTGIRGVVFNDESSANYSNDTPSVIVGHTGHAFDIATSTELTFNNFVASNVGGTVPKTVFFSARNAGGAGCGLHRWNNCRTAFNSTFSWFYYGYGSEENNFYGCETSNNQAGSGMFSHNQTNPAGYTSTFVTIATGAQSNSENHHYGFGYFNFGNSGSQNEIIFQLENTSNFTARDGTWGVAHGLAYTNILGNTASTNLTFDSIRGEPLGGGLQPKYGVEVTNTAGTHESWTFNNVTADAVNDLLHFNATDTPAIQNLAMRASTCTSGKVLTLYSMSDSIIETLIDSVITGAVGGTVTNNVFIGGRNNITLSGTFNSNIYIDNNTGTVGIDADSYVAASTACTGALTTAVSWSLRLSSNGKMVTLALPPTIGTTTASASFTYGVVIPSTYRPPAAVRSLVIIEDNGATLNQPGIVFINNSTGAISIFKDVVNSGTWTNGDTGGLPALTEVSWNL